jgi:hypothetical protein
MILGNVNDRVGGGPAKALSMGNSNCQDSFFFSFFFFFLVIMGFELMSSCLLGKNSTTRTMPPALFLLVIFQIGSHCKPRLVWTTILLFVLPYIVEVAGVCHCIRPLVKMRSRELSARADLELQSS